MRSIFHSTLCALSTLGILSVTSHATVIEFNLVGTTSYDGWEINSSNYSGYPGYPGFGAWPQPLGSNTANSGDAGIHKLANAADGSGPFPAGSSLYFPGGDSSTLGGTLGLRDSTIVSGLRTLVLQLDISESVGNTFLNDIFPTLYINGGSEETPATFYGIIDRIYNGQQSTPEGLVDVYRNTWGFQWDLESLYTEDPSLLISSISIEWSQVGHSSTFAVQLDQSSQVYSTSMVPEPGSAMLLAGALGATLLARRRRK